MSDTEASGKPRVYVSVLFCDSVIREDSKLLTAIRVHDGYVLNPLKIAPAHAGEERSSIVLLPIKFVAIIRFCSEAPVAFNWTIRGIRPSGQPLSSSEPEPMTARIDPGAEGLTVTSNIRISSWEQGDYWFEFCVDDVVVTKAPVRIVFGDPIGPLEAIAEVEFRRGNPSESV
jgi:hypothetical protein